MKHETTENQAAKKAHEAADKQPCASKSNPSADNVADGSDSAADKVADDQNLPEEPLLSELERAQAEATEWKNQMLRLTAEFDNYRKRTLKEKMDLVQNGGQEVLKSILPILDDVLRAVDASEKSDDIQALREGEKLVAQKFCDTLQKKGVTEIEILGCDFNEELCEAVARFAAGEEKKGKVIEVVERGYMLGEKVLRFAKVVVGE